MKKIILIGTALFLGGRLVAMSDNGAVSVVPKQGAAYMLHQAAESGDLPEVVGQILGGADIERRDGLGRTPADIALVNGKYKIFYYLLDVKAFLNANSIIS